MAARSSPRVLQQGWWEWGGHNGAGGPDDSLTSLEWLQGFSFRPADPEEAPSSPNSSSRLMGPSRELRGSYGPASPPAGDTAAEGVPPKTGRPTPSSTSLRPAPAHTSGAPDYKADPRAKPPYSYATLICMAMQASPGSRLSLAAIYAWITENFCYFRHAEPGWQNSVRHNLSLNRCFQKVPRGKEEPGKGGLWQIDPHYAHTLANGGFPRKRMPALPSPAARARPRSCRRERPGSLWGVKGRQLPPVPAPGLETPNPLGTPHWAWGLQEETLSDADPTSEELELRVALGTLAPPEDSPSLSQLPPLGTLSHAGTSSPPPAGADEALMLPLTQPWEEAGAEPLLATGWEEDDDDDPCCLAQSFLVEMHPWQG